MVMRIIVLILVNLSINQIAFRLLDGKWVLIIYAPDKSKVKQRMLYSSTTATMKTGLGNQYISGEYHTSLLVFIYLTKSQN
jgi:hypothetical protein